MVRQIGDNQKDIILNYVGLNYPECLYLYMDINNIVLIKERYLYGIMKMVVTLI